MEQEKFPKGTGTSYGELVVLQDMFEDQLEKAGAKLDEETKLDCWLDFCEQYEQGSMDPKIRLL